MGKSKHLKTDWEGFHDRIILYADIMGFKATLKSTSHEVIVKKLRNFIRNLSLHLSPYQTGEHLRMTLFSDLVVIAADRCTIPNFMLIISAAAALMRECYLYDFPLNGCITCGPLTFDGPDACMDVVANYSLPGSQTDGQSSQNSAIKSSQRSKAYMPLFVGQAVVDAYLLNEDLFCYGLVLHPKVEDLYKKASNVNPLPFCKLPVPLKSGGFANLFYLDWNKVKLAKNTISLTDVIAKTTEIEASLVPRSRVYARNTNQLLQELNKIVF